MLIGEITISNDPDSNLIRKVRFVEFRDLGVDGITTAAELQGRVHWYKDENGEHIELNNVRFKPYTLPSPLRIDNTTPVDIDGNYLFDENGNYDFNHVDYFKPEYDYIKWALDNGKDIKALLIQGFLRADILGKKYDV